MMFPETNRDVTLKPHLSCEDLKDILSVSEYISKNKIIIKTGLFKIRADLECLNLAFNEFTFHENFKGKKLRLPRVFDSWLTCLALI